MWNRDREHPLRVVDIEAKRAGQACILSHLLITILVSNCVRCLGRYFTRRRLLRCVLGLLQPMFLEVPRKGRGALVLYADNHVIRLDEQLYDRSCPAWVCALYLFSNRGQSAGRDT